MSKQLLLGAVCIFATVALAGCSANPVPVPASSVMPSAAAATPARQTTPSATPTINVRAAASESVTIQPHFFDQQGEKHGAALGGGWETSPAFLVVSQDQDKAAKALRAAAVRFYFVDQDGKELTRGEMTGDYPQYTPNFISDVYLTDLGPMIYADTKGELSTGMAEGMLRILVAELRSQEVAAVVTAPPKYLSWENSPTMKLFP